MLTDTAASAPPPCLLKQEDPEVPTRGNPEPEPVPGTSNMEFDGGLDMASTSGDRFFCPVGSGAKGSGHVSKGHLEAKPLALL